MWCFHDRFKQFKFSDGVLIECCVDCTTFDNRRIEALRVGNAEMPKATEQTHWGFMLEEAGLSDQLAGNHLVDNGGSLQNLAKLPSYAYHLPDECAEVAKFIYVLPTLKRLYDQRRIDAKKGYTMLDDKEHVERARPFAHTLTMSRALRNFCPRCSTYSTADHECQGNNIQQSTEIRAREQERAQREVITFSNPDTLAPSQILKALGGYGTTI